MKVLYCKVAKACKSDSDFLFIVADLYPYQYEMRQFESAQLHQKKHVVSTHSFSSLLF